MPEHVVTIRFDPDEMRWLLALCNVCELVLDHAEDVPAEVYRAALDAASLVKEQSDL